MNRIPYFSLCSAYSTCRTRTHRPPSRILHVRTTNSLSVWVLCGSPVGPSPPVVGSLGVPPSGSNRLISGERCAAHRAALRAHPRYSLPAPRFGLYNIFVCWIRECALINTIPGTRRLLHCPPLYVAIGIGQYVIYGFPPSPLFCHSTYNIGIGIANIV